MYLDATLQSVSIEKMDNTSFNPSVCTVIKDGNLECDKTEVKVEVPQEGSTITFEKGKIKEVTLKYSNNKTIVKNTEGSLVYGDSEADDEKEVLVPGLCNDKWELVYSWEELIEIEAIEIYNETRLSEAPYGYADYLCGNLVISEDIEILGDLLFSECNELKSITIPNSVTKFSCVPFIDCDSLTTIYYLGTMEEWNDIENSDFDNIEEKFF